MKTSAIERVLKAVEVDPISHCWCCTIGIQRNGYSHIQIGPGRFALAHRVAYEAYIAPIPAGLTIDHVADRGCVHRNCVNPLHLEPVTRSENIRRSSAPSAVAARTGICQRGHSDWTTNGSGKRTCRQCIRDRRSRSR